MGRIGSGSAGGSKKWIVDVAGDGETALFDEWVSTSRIDATNCAKACADGIEDAAGFVEEPITQRRSDANAGVIGGAATNANVNLSGAAFEGIDQQFARST